MYPWMSYPDAHAFEEEAKRLHVSVVARSPKGFMREYQRSGTPQAMERRALPPGVSGGTTWGEKRNGFIARHLKQYRANPTYRRFLALIMWAYRPPGAIPRPVRRSKRSRRS